MSQAGSSDRIKRLQRLKTTQAQLRRIEELRAMELSAQRHVEADRLADLSRMTQSDEVVGSHFYGLMLQGMTRQSDRLAKIADEAERQTTRLLEQKAREQGAARALDRFMARRQADIDREELIDIMERLGSTHATSLV